METHSLPCPSRSPVSCTTSPSRSIPGSSIVSGGVGVGMGWSQIMELGVARSLFPAARLIRRWTAAEGPIPAALQTTANSAFTPRSM